MEGNENETKQVNTTEGANNNVVKPANTTIETNKKAAGNTAILIIIVLLIAAGVCVFALKDSLFKTNTGNNGGSNTTIEPAKLKSSYRLNGNGLNDFDLAFLQLENNGKNKVYSPLSIKYALEMLAEGADGDTKTQLDAVIGDYKVYTYPNNANMSFANAMFIKNDYKDQVLSSYVDSLKNKYNAEVKYDSFNNPATLNSWISDKTLKLIDNMFDDSISGYDYFLVNALAIDMEWVNKIQSINDVYHTKLAHEQVELKSGITSAFYVYSLNSVGYGLLEFEGVDYKAATVTIGAVANKYDIISELGEDNIRSTVQAEYDKYVKENGKDEEFDIDSYVDELKTNYNHISSSTDFLFYDNDDVKVFAKDLKSYNNKTLQYIGIMPKSESLTNYIKNTDSTKINSIVSNLKTIDLNSFEDGYLTYIHGQIPLFEYEYELKLMEDLKSIGIKDVFDAEKANLSKMTSSSSYIASAEHKANILFSNDGIKASAVTSLGGLGNAGVGFNYDFDIPVKEIDLTFDKPYMYIIRDKSTGEVWFTGSVYEPLKFTESLNGN